MDRLGVIADLDLGVEYITKAAKRYADLYPEHKDSRAHRLINSAQAIRSTRDVIEQEWRLEVEEKRNSVEKREG